VLLQVADRGITAVNNKLVYCVAGQCLRQRAKSCFGAIERCDHLQQVSAFTRGRWPAENVQTCRDQPLLNVDQLLVQFEDFLVFRFGHADYGTAGVSFTNWACRICANLLVSWLESNSLCVSTTTT
jgi:hypothetical protein